MNTSNGNSAGETPKHRFQTSANLATTFGALIALVAAFVALWTYWGTEKLQRELSAYQIWREHLALSVQYPEYSTPGAASKIFKGGTNEVPDPKYQWFVVHAMHAAELTQRLQPGDEGWKDTAKELIRVHKPYVTSEYFIPKHWSPALLGLIEEVKAEH